MPSVVKPAGSAMDFNEVHQPKVSLGSDVTVEGKSMEANDSHSQNVASPTDFKVGGNFTSVKF